MTSMASALADVLAADRNLGRLERACWPREDEAMQCARNELETASEALIAAMDEHLKATIHRAVASLPGQTAVPTQDYET